MTQKGHIRKKGDVYYAVWFVTGPAGERQQRSKSSGPGGKFRLKRDAQRFLNETLVAVDEGRYSDPAKITVAALLVEHWLPSLKDRRPNTVSSYGTVCKKWLIPHLGGELLPQLTPKRVRDALDALADHGAKGGGPLGDRSVAYAKTVLTMALKWAVSEGMVPRNAAATVKRASGNAAERDCWTAEQAGAFLAGTADHRLYCAWLLFLTRGFRRGELAGLRWSDVDLDAGRISVRHTRVMIDGKAATSTPKTDRSTRTVPLDPVLVDALRAHQHRQKVERLAAGPAWTDTGYVFVNELGVPVIPENLSTVWERLVARAGLPAISLHGARHTAATCALRAGIPLEVVSRWLGHASVSITADIYGHAVPQLLEQAGATVTNLMLSRS